MDFRSFPLPHAAGRRVPWLAGLPIAIGLAIPPAPPLDLRHVRMGHALFSGLALSGADFSGARLPDANFAFCNLRRANFQGADLRRATFSSAVLTDADLSGADLRGACLAGCTLQGARLDGVGYDENTSWPEGFLPPDQAVRPAAFVRRLHPPARSGSEESGRPEGVTTGDVPEDGP